MFADVEEVKKKKKKTAEALKGIKVDEFKNCSEHWEKTSLPGIWYWPEHGQSPGLIPSGSDVEQW